MFKRHASGWWYEFLLPRTIVDNDELKMTRWFNLYFCKRRKIK